MPRHAAKIAVTTISTPWEGLVTQFQDAVETMRSIISPAKASVAALAEKLGITLRHLARLFERHVGASPQQVATTRRVQRASGCSTPPTIR